MEEVLEGLEAFGEDAVGDGEGEVGGFYLLGDLEEGGSAVADVVDDEAVSSGGFFGG